MIVNVICQICIKASSVPRQSEVELFHGKKQTNGSITFLHFMLLSRHTKIFTYIISTADCQQFILRVIAHRCGSGEI